jgi:membrane protease YdiL (CAAX protease family)
MGILFGLVIGAVAIAVVPILYFWGITPLLPQVSTQHLPGYFLFVCIYAPLVEEVIYRSLLAAAIEPTFGSTGTIIAGGVIFAAAHVVNGNPGPDNQIAGFLLMWAFLRSGTILVPLAMHAAGNMVAVMVHVAAGVWQA